MKFDFSKNRKVKSLSDVPENFHVFYEEVADGEGFQLKADAVTTAAVATITGLNNSLTTARGERDAAKSAKIDLSALSDFGSDPESIAESFKAKLAEASSKASQGQKDVAERIAGLERKHAEAMAKTVADKDTEIAAQKKALHGFMKESALANAASNFPGLSLKLISPHALQHMDVDESGDSPVVVIRDAAGNPRYSTNPDRAGELMNGAELLTEMSQMDDYKRVFPSDQADTGGGAQTRTTPVSVRRADKTANMSPAEKISAGLKKQQRS